MTHCGTLNGLYVEIDTEEKNSENSKTCSNFEWMLSPRLPVTICQQALARLPIHLPTAKGFVRNQSLFGVYKQIFLYANAELGH